MCLAFGRPDFSEPAAALGVFAKLSSFGNLSVLSAGAATFSASNWPTQGEEKVRL